MKKKKWIPSLTLIFAIHIMLFAATGYATGLEQMTRLSVTTSSQTFGSLSITVDNIPPWDINKIDFTAPDGVQDSWNGFHDWNRWAVKYTHQQGTTYRFKDNKLQHSVNGEYNATITDWSNSNYSEVSDTYTFNQMPVVDMSTTNPAQLDYIPTTTPTLKWSAATSNTTTTLYYRVDIFKVQEDSAHYQSEVTTETTVNIPSVYPDSGHPILKDAFRYKWRVMVFDSPIADQRSNISVSDFNIFYIKTPDSNPELDPCYAHSRSKAGEASRTRFMGTIKNILPLDVKITVKDHLGTLIHTIENLTYADSSGWFSWKPENNDLPRGEYTLEMLETHTGASLDSCTVDYQPNWHLLPVEEIFSPDDRAVIPTETPTFSWMPVTEATHYRVTIYSYSWDISVYTSAISPDTTVTIPANYLMKNSAYQARISAYDAAGNRTDSEWKDFFISDDIEPAHISGTIHEGSSGYEDGDTILVAAFSTGSLLDDDTFLGMTAINSLGSYTINNMRLNTPIYLYALWDIDNNGELSPGEYEGWHSENAIQLTTTGTTAGHDITLSTLIEEASISGTISIDHFQGGYGPVHVRIFKDDIAYGELAGSVQLSTPGEYTVAGLVAGMQYSVAAYWDIDNSGSDGPTPGDAGKYYTGNPLITIAGDNKDVDISLEVGGSIHGTITDGSIPIANLVVDFFDSETYNYVGTTDTDENGEYVYYLPPGTYHVNACPQCSNEPYIDETVSSITIAALQQVEVPFSLKTGGTICGTVTADSSPMNNIHVYFADSATDEYIGGTNTNANGEYCYMLLPDSSYNVTACPACSDQPQNFANQTHPLAVAVSLDTTVNDINFELEQGGEICGTITDGTSALDNIHVYFEDSTHEPKGGTNTDSNGKYCYTLPEGTYFVTACPTCANQNFTDETYHSLVAVTVDTPSNSINFELKLGGQINGTINDSKGNLIDGSITPIFIDIFTGDGDDACSAQQIGGASLMVDGSYSINGLPAGDYFVLADDQDDLYHLDEWYATGSSSPDCTLALKITVGEGGEVNNINFNLDIIDECPNDPNKTEPGLCGCGASDTDTDGDSTADCNDECVNDPDKINEGQCGCGTADTDCDNPNKFPWTMFLPAILNQATK